MDTSQLHKDFMGTNLLLLFHAELIVLFRRWFVCLCYNAVISNCGICFAFIF